MARTAPINVIAAFRNPAGAKSALKRLTRSGISKADVHLVGFESTDRERRSALRAEMSEEVTEGLAGPGVSMMTSTQAKGMFRGVAAGAVIGALLGAAGGLIWALGTDGPATDLARFFLVFVPALIAGSVAGAVIGGGLMTRTDDLERPGTTSDDVERLEAERDTLVSVHVTDEDAAARAQRVLEESGADRVDAVDASGNPLPPGAEPGARSK